MLIQAPTTSVLRDGVRRALEQHIGSPISVTSLTRSALPRAGSFPAERVDCVLEDGAAFSIRCKYGRDGCLDADGSRGGVGYESDVYRLVLQPLGVSTARYYGSYRDRTTGTSWLMVEYMEDVRRLHQAPDSFQAIVDASTWIGAFHRATEPLPEEPYAGFLRRYTRQYYVAWAARVVTEYMAQSARPKPSVQTVSIRFRNAVSLLADAPVVIHGEYYPKNVLWDHGCIRPVDWETAAVAAGEIDLASLTEAWPDKTVRECEDAYLAARWTTGEPPGFRERLSVARIYLHLRWLGHRPGTDYPCADDWRLAALEREAEKLGLL
jgi:hypothetical protein